MVECGLIICFSHVVLEQRLEGTSDETDNQFAHQKFGSAFISSDQSSSLDADRECRLVRPLLKGGEVFAAG